MRWTRSLICLVLAAGTAHAEEEEEADPPVRDDIVLLGGVMGPGGGFFEQRFCRLKGQGSHACSNLIVGRQRGAQIFDFMGSWGWRFRVRGIDVTPSAGFSVGWLVLLMGQLGAMVIGG